MVKSKTATKKVQILNNLDQTLANRGRDSRFVLEAIIKALISKSSRSLILKTPNCLHTIRYFQPDSSLSEYLNFHMCLHNYLII